MADILYSELKDDVLDRLNFKVKAGLINESARQLLIADQRIAKAASEALLGFCRLAEASSVPDLVDEITLTKVRTYNHVNSYKWPEENFAEREDRGILSIILDTEEMDWNQAIDRESVEYRANSVMYGKKEHCFAVEDFKRRFYAPENVPFKLLIFRMPHSIRSADQNEFRGADLAVTNGADTATGNVTLSDGTNSITIALTNGDTASQVASKITDAVNAETTFYYDAFLNGSTVILAHRHDMPLDKILAPSFTDTDTTGAAATITDRGTYRLPVGLSYLDELAELTESALLSPVVGRAASQATDSETEKATEG